MKMRKPLKELPLKAKKKEECNNIKIDLREIGCRNVN
jgi:hypothetical protein